MRQSKFHRDIDPLYDLWKTNKKPIEWDAPNWKEVCSSFYHACGGINDLGDPEQVDALCKEYASHFEENDNDEDN